MSILSLKVLFGTEAGKDTKHFADERRLLLSELAGRTLNGKWFDAVIDLAAVNAALWHAEDDLRAMRVVGQLAHNQDDIVEMAFRIQELNDTRAALVEKINKDSGDHIGSEKVSDAS